MAQPSPGVPGASHGDRPTVVDHLMCHCQLSAFVARTMSLCGVDLTDEDLDTDAAEQPCVVCCDLGAAVAAARRCERCPT